MEAAVMSGFNVPPRYKIGATDVYAELEDSEVWHVAVWIVARVYWCGAPTQSVGHAHLLWVGVLQKHWFFQFVSILR